MNGYSGETVDELLALEGKFRTDSLVCAFEEAMDQKAAREGDHALSTEERVILAIEALEREVSNGGYWQFFKNSSREYASIIVPALGRIGCPRTAAITQKAIDALNLADLTEAAIEGATDDLEDDDVLSQCDELYFNAGEDIAGHLFLFIKSNRDAIAL